MLGVPSEELIDLVAATLAELGAEYAFVVHGAGGLDEISLAGASLVAEIRKGAVRRYQVTPEDFAVSRAPIEAVRGASAQENATTIRGVLQGQNGPARDIVVANAAAALVAASVAADFLDGAQLAVEALRSGAALAKLETLVAFTKG